MMAEGRGPHRVVGRYALYSEIAAGGMATVHIGRLLGPVGFARTVAIKRLHPQYAKDPEFVSGFLDEARIAARVQHPNVVATIDVVATDGELFLIMDYVRGESLSKILRACRPLNVAVPPRIATSIICGFLHGLHAAHEAKNERGEPLHMVHRDVSPQNVLVGSDGIARVLDFGIAKAAGRIQVTRDGQIKGKLAYMPPEQLSGRELTRAVDIYASAVVMWESVTGERLFKGETEGETLAKILRDPVPLATSYVPSLPRALDDVLSRALSRDPSRRHRTARDLALDLERCVGLASPTEVGEWVESIVGDVIAAREDHIASIESASTTIPVSPSGRPEPEASSDTSGPYIPSNRAGTLLGVGPPGPIPKDLPRHLPDDAVASGVTVIMDPRAVAGPRMRIPTPTVPTKTAPVEAFDPDSSLASRSLVDPDSSLASRSLVDPDSSLASRSLVDHTDGAGSPMTETRSTMTMTSPIGRRISIYASIAGLLVLFAIVGVIIANKGTLDTAAKAEVATPPPSPSSAPPPAAAPQAAAEEPAAASAEPAPAQDAKPAASASASAHVAQAAHAAPPPRPSPRPAVTTAPPAPPAPAKKNCDPPYTVDASGHRRYKLECM